MKFEYPSQLPVSAARSDIAEAVKSSQVVIVSGQTGSGKTTQLPKILLELGRGSHGRQIVHTQPRRLAARTVAERIAAEMACVWATRSAIKCVSPMRAHRRLVFAW